MRPTSRSASPSKRDSSATGNSATASSPRSSPGISDQISSVTNGITGWSSLRIRSSDQSSTAETSSLSSSYRRGLASSRYQSASSDQKPPESSSAANEKRKSSYSSVTRAVSRSSLDTIQRSSTVTTAPASASTSATRSRISRAAFHSLFARSRPCFTRSSLNFTSWDDDIASRPNRRASAPYAGKSPPSSYTGGRGPPWIRADGSMPVPSDFDMRRPSGAWMTEWMFTSVNGTCSVSSLPNITIRATQRKMMSRAVESTSVGWNARSCSVPSGQPSVANGQSPDENQVSSTSGSRSQPSPEGASSPT